MSDTGERPFFESSDVTIWHADAREAADWLPEDGADAIVTSPPYFALRDYGVDGQLGLEACPEDYIEDLADTLTAYVRVLKPGGSLWLNLGDTYATRSGQGFGPGGKNRAVQAAGAHAPRHRRGVKVGDFEHKCLLMIPERVALALIERGWILRNKVVWSKPNGMPESVQDRLAGRWEHVFHLVRRRHYYFDLDAIREPHSHISVARAKRARNPLTGAAADAYFGNPPTADPSKLGEGGKNPGDVWDIPTQAYPEAHFAVFPEALVERPIKATVPPDGVVLDPFFGSGTTGVMARKLGRCAWGVELNEDYCALAADRFAQEVLPLPAAGDVRFHDTRTQETP